MLFTDLQILFCLGFITFSLMLLMLYNNIKAIFACCFVFIVPVYLTVFKIERLHEAYQRRRRHFQEESNKTATVQLSYQFHIESRSYRGV